MSGRKRPWSVTLTDEAERDFSHILRWTAEQFGAPQAARYLTTLLSAIEELAEGPKAPGIKTREDVAIGLLALHVRSRRRKARHVLYFRVIEHRREIAVLRILHDAMDPGLHLET